jgi:hypothetical protein
MTLRGVLAIFGLLLAAHGCGDDSTGDDAGEKPRVCVPGTVYSCFRAGCKGHQSCLSDGSGMSQCSCERDEDAGGMPAADSCKADGQSSCHGAAPTDWSGPIALHSSERETPSCQGAFSERVFEGGAQPSAAAASCSSCTCSPSGSACAAFVDFSTGSEAGCGGASCTTSVNQSCSEIMPPCLAGMSSAYLGTKLPSGAGTCSPSKQSAQMPDVKWAKRVAGCKAPATSREDCEADHVCVAKPDDDAKLCVYRAGEHDCPAQVYTHREVYHRDVDDTRSCSACACSGPSCSYTWSVFNAADTSCASPIIKLTSADQCVQVNPSADKLRVGATVSGDGTCKASGGESSGAVSGSEPVTVCCET